MNIEIAPTRFVIALFLPFILAGCPSITLVQLDNEWIRTYQSKAALRQSSKDFIASLSSFDENFAKISDHATEEAKKEKNPENEVALYRIAILSAWQSQGKREHRIVDLSMSGRAACGKLKDGDKSQPRDCALFRIVPAFALYEKKIPFVEAVIESSKSGKTLTLEEETVIFEKHAELNNDFNLLTTERANLLHLSLDEKFRAYIDEQWRRVYCTANGLVGVVSTNNSDMNYRNKAMQDELIRAGAYRPCQTSEVAATR